MKRAGWKQDWGVAHKPKSCNLGNSPECGGCAGSFYGPPKLSQYNVLKYQGQVEATILVSYLIGFLVVVQRNLHGFQPGDLRVATSWQWQTDDCSLESVCWKQLRNRKITVSWCRTTKLVQGWITRACLSFARVLTLTTYLDSLVRYTFCLQETIFLLRC